VNRDGDGGTAASRAERPEAASPDRSAPVPDASAGAEAAAGVRDLGDLGDVSDAGDLRQRVRAGLERPPPAARASAPACLQRAVTGTPAPTAYGTGTHRGREVLVLVLPSTGDRSTAVLLDTGTCRAVSVADLS
jgi:hypothetical protein